VHGGIVMKWMDQAGYACTAQWSSRYCVTVSIGGIRFIRPILVGQMVTLKAQVVHTEQKQYAYLYKHRGW
jgi:acyl-CoA hydrolase